MDKVSLLKVKQEKAAERKEKKLMENITRLRKMKAKKLSVHLGFPITKCIAALAATDDDFDAAAEWILQGGIVKKEPGKGRDKGHVNEDESDEEGHDGESDSEESRNESSSSEECDSYPLPRRVKKEKVSFEDDDQEQERRKKKKRKKKRKRSDIIRNDEAEGEDDNNVCNRCAVCKKKRNVAQETTVLEEEKKKLEEELKEVQRRLRTKKDENQELCLAIRLCGGQVDVMQPLESSPKNLKKERDQQPQQQAQQAQLQAILAIKRELKEEPPHPSTPIILDSDSDDDVIIIL